MMWLAGTATVTTQGLTTSTTRRTQSGDFHLATVWVLRLGHQWGIFRLWHTFRGAGVARVATEMKPYGRTMAVM